MIDPMIVLASGSATRAKMLRDAGITFKVAKPLVDEDAIKAAMIAEGAKPRDLADNLAEVKARAVGYRMGAGTFVLGADQIVSLSDRVFSKPATPEYLAAQLHDLSGQTHKIFTAAVIYDGPNPVWRQITEAQLTMRPLSNDFIATYVEDHFETARHSAGGYLIEGVGAQLFTAITGDYHAILGLPLLPVLGYLRERGVLAQ